jgi:predicted PhzF superfamily epimerase YddE/YHI9
MSYFPPGRYGINEDPVTGSAHCALAPYWTDRVRAMQTSACATAAAHEMQEVEGAQLLVLRGYQASGRGGAVSVTVDGERVRLSGHCVTTMRTKVVA